MTQYSFNNADYTNIYRKAGRWSLFWGSNFIPHGHLTQIALLFGHR